jgi:LysR family transcriptional activator of nhaA
MFSLSQELLNALEHQTAGPAVRLAVGLLDVIPKPLARQLLMPAFELGQPIRLVCHEDKADRLISDLAARRTDMVLSDAPIGAGVQLRGFNHLLRESSISFFAAKSLANRCRRGFPKSLNDVPLLLPTGHTQLRRSLNPWLEAKRIHPVVAGEFDDSAMMFWFGRGGTGVFPAPTIIEADLQREMGVKVVGRAHDVRERYYAITREESPLNPAIRAVCAAARPAR